ncbi:Hsp20/alpha crystallin family protein [Neobacillus jeddahensis]|uniref:Hsp20/alpha crystallin family protein n=1 Tax=Neobacillus jeddahensis TaxID=1461580 RepID=UPI00058C1931|nr:Hsp20/alpha crystallin family protein [Neobacillus jeddahensis]
MTKKKPNPNQACDFALVEKWLENYFLDPLTSYFDQTQFQIDLYETENEWIVEAILSDFDASEIKVYMEDTSLQISAHKSPQSAQSYKKCRSLEFPFLIIKHEVHAHFASGILEIFISKTETGLGKNRFITLP